jgi:hypothetical protein
LSGPLHRRELSRELDLRGCAAKLNRADEHLQTLHARIEDWSKANPLNTPTEPEADGWYLLKFEGEPFPVDIGVVVGDVVHNLRSALDHAVWQLVQRNIRRRYKPTPSERHARQIQFPIYDKRPKFQEAITLRYLTTRQVAFVRRYQPYRRRKNAPFTPLAQIAALSNTDKHRVVHPAYTALETAGEATLTITTNLHAGTVEDIVPVAHPLEPLESGATLTRLRFNITGPNPQVHVKPNLPMGVLIGDAPGMRLATLSQLHEFTLQVIYLLELKFG